MVVRVSVLGGNGGLNRVVAEPAELFTRGS